MSKNEVKEDKILHNEEKQPLLSQSHIDNSLRQKTEVSIIIKHDTSEFDLFKGLIFMSLSCLFKSAEDVIVREVKDDVHFMAYPFFYSLIGILLFPIPMAINDRVYPSFNIYEVFLLFLIGLCTFMYQMFMALGLQNENAGRVSMINYLQVALMYLSDLFIFHKNFQWLDFTGIMLIFGFNFTNGILKAVARMKQLEEVKKKHQNEQANTNGLPQPDLRNNTSPTSNNV